MHLGQAAKFLAETFNRPEASVLALSRLFREGGYVRKGPRGRNAAHLNSDEAAGLVIAIMASPDSPATAMSRLDHICELRLDTESTEDRIRFANGLALLMERLASESWEDVCMKKWKIGLRLDTSSAHILAEGEEHHFNNLVDADPDAPAIDAMPFFGGLQVHIQIGSLHLFRIAKCVLANEPDPWPSISASLEGHPGRVSSSDLKGDDHALRF